MAVIKPSVGGSCTWENPSLCVSVLWHTGLFCEASVLSVQHLLLQLCGHALRKVPMRLVGVPGDRAEGAAPKFWEESGNCDQQNTHFKCHQVWKLSNHFLLVQPQSWQVCAASLGKAVFCWETLNGAFSHPATAGAVSSALLGPAGL